jgi:hypothetical protein
VNAALDDQAEEGLLRILQQFFQVGDDHPDMDIVIGTFQEYIRNTDHDLHLKPIPNLNQSAWMTARGKNAFWAVLSAIALRFESLVCNEGVTERTNGTMKRLLSPFRLNMGGDVLLARMNLSKHMPPGSATGVCIASHAMDEIHDPEYDIPE